MLMAGEQLLAAYGDMSSRWRCCGRSSYITLRAHVFEDGVTNASSRRHPRFSAGVRGVFATTVCRRPEAGLDAGDQAELDAALALVEPDLAAPGVAPRR